SPQLLEVFATGSKDRLTRLGIGCVIENPSVGENLQDHGFVMQSFEVNEHGPGADQIQRDREVFKAALAEYQAS
ncbi:MAG: hypothetical protein Q9181_006981, partial [Wetmoreana brouardii]